jgi:hypothetical protein
MNSADGSDVAEEELFNNWPRVIVHLYLNQAQPLD